MTSYSRDFTLTLTADGSIAALDFPGRGTLERLAVANLYSSAPNSIYASEASEGGYSPDSVVAALFNRAFTSAAIPLVSVTDVGGLCRLTLHSWLPAKVGDMITIADTSVAGYNLTQQVRITGYNSNWVTGVHSLDTDLPYSADATGGTVMLDIPTVEQNLYLVDQIITGTDFATSEGSGLPVAYCNQDPRPAGFAAGYSNLGVNRKLYLRCEVAGVFRVSLVARESVGMN